MTLVTRFFFCLLNRLSLSFKKMCVMSVIKKIKFWFMSDADARIIPS